jgi:hypothetical protein
MPKVASAICEAFRQPGIWAAYARLPDTVSALADKNDALLNG